MRIINVRISDLSEQNLWLGYVGENEHTQIQINCASVFADYPDATVEMTVKPPQGDTYTANVTTEGVIVFWDVVDTDLVYDGSGNFQLTFTESGVVTRSPIGSFTISESIEPPPSGT